MLELTSLAANAPCASTPDAPALAAMVAPVGLVLPMRVEPLPPPGFVWATPDDGEARVPTRDESVPAPLQEAPANESPFAGVLRSKVGRSRALFAVPRVM